MSIISRALFTPAQSLVDVAGRGYRSISDLQVADDVSHRLMNVISGLATRTPLPVHDDMSVTNRVINGQLNQDLEEKL